MVDAQKTIVIDNGSGFIKAGFAGEDAPRAVFPNIVGRLKKGSVYKSLTQQSEFIGDQAIKTRGLFNLQYPIIAGMIESWEDMEKIWHHTFYNELRCDPEEAVGVSMIVPLINNEVKKQLEKMVNLLFEKFQIKNFYLADQSATSLFAAGRTTGLACNSGFGVTTTTPVFGGFSIPYGIGKTEISGQVLTEYMQKLLNEAEASLEAI